MPGKGKVISTGKLGDVMKESIQAAESYVKSRALDFGIEPPRFEKNDIHVHVPEARGDEIDPAGLHPVLPRLLQGLAASRVAELLATFFAAHHPDHAPNGVIVHRGSLEATATQ